MDVTPLISAESQVIQAYADGGFRVSGTAYKGALFVGVDASTPCSQAADKKAQDLTFDDFAPLIEKAADIDVVLLGTGAAMAFLPAPLRQQLKQAGLTIEYMDTAAACRTYNVLMAEGRRVVAALLPI